MGERAHLAAVEQIAEDEGAREGASAGDFGIADIAAMREQGDLRVFMRLQIRPMRSTVKVMTLWQRFTGPTGHKPGAWPSAAPLGAHYRRASGAPELCDCARCRVLAAACEEHPCRCPRCGAPHPPAA